MLATAFYDFLCTFVSLIHLINTKGIWFWLAFITNYWPHATTSASFVPE